MRASFDRDPIRGVRYNMFTCTRLLSSLLFVAGLLFGIAGSAVAQDPAEVPEPVDTAAAESAPARDHTRAPSVRHTPGGDHLGTVVATIGDLDGDRATDILVGAYDSDSTGDNAGVVLVLSGASGDTIRFLVGEGDGDTFGAAVISPGDLNGDGVPDIVVGAPNWDLDDSTGSRAGRVYAISGADASPLYELEGSAGGNRFGLILAALGDVNGDGGPDFAISQLSQRDTSGTDYGLVWVVAGRTGETLHRFRSGRRDDRFGLAVAGAGDTDSDGRADIIVGAYRDSQKGLSAGAAYVFSGRSGEVLHTFYGEDLFNQFGYAVGGGEDVNGDGQADVIVGARFSDAGGGRSGRVYVFSGRDGRSLHVIDAQDAGEHFGSSVLFAGDIDRDGRSDLLVGAVSAEDGGEVTGAVYLFSLASGQLMVRRAGERRGESFGMWLARADDIEGDGLPDLVIGAGGSDAGGLESGRACVISGASGATLWTVTGTSTLAAADTIVTAPLVLSTEALMRDTLDMGFPIFDSTEVDVTPIIRRSVAAEYPVTMMESGLTGWVFVKILVLPDGSAGEVRVTDDSGLGPEFQAAAIAAAKSWTFLAAQREGETVAAWAVFPIGFSPPAPPDSTLATDAALAAYGLGPDSLPPAGDSLVPAPDTTVTDTLPAPAVYEEDEVDQAPTVSARVEPEYPIGARVAGDTGTVSLHVLVDSTGRVMDVEVESVTTAGKGFEAAAETAVRRWRFEPGMLGGRPVSVWVEHELEFHIEAPSE